MSRIASHHNEWKSLLDVSGPFLSLPVLLDVFPNGLDDVDSEVVSNMRSAYEEWLDAKQDVAIHAAWIDYVLAQLLGFSQEWIQRGPSIPTNLSAYIPQQALTLRPSMVLTDPSSQEPRLLINKYEPGQKLDRPPFGEASMSCLARMLELLHASQVPLGLITNGEEWTLVHAPVGETASYISFYAHLWFSERLTLRAFFTLLKTGRFFGVQDEETLPALFTLSAENQHEITDQLGGQVRSAVQILIQAIDKADQDTNRKLLKDVSTDLLYEAAITVMMRLVFLLYAEERELLPIKEGVYYEHYAIVSLADQLRSESDRVGEEILERHYDAWARILSASRLVYGGIRHDRLNMPAYGGSLFDPDRFAFLEGRGQGTEWQSELAQPLLIDNRTVLHILDNIQYLYIREYGQKQRLSFRALDIEQIGHIYESLLEYKAARAEAILVGLAGNQGYPLPLMALDELEQLLARDLGNFANAVKDITGKSITSIKNRVNKDIDLELSSRLRIACHNNETLYTRVAPFAHLLRADDYDKLVIIQPGSVYVARGTTRRATGTHYTPRSLTEPIVQHTLEPLVYEGPAEGLSQEEWTLRPPVALLNLKICDMAMGSGSFLVQVIRYLSERLVESWERRAPVTEPGKRPGFYLTPEGGVLESPTGEELPNDLDARHLLARRLVADRCIYGVDKNHLAVEMAKLSVWLITLDRERPFTFLDHALKCGDSLVGADEADFLNWARGQSNTAAWSLFDAQIRQELEEARAKRRELEDFQVHDMTDLAMKAELLKAAEQATQRIKLGCDLLVGARLQGLSANDQEAEESLLLMQWMAGETENHLRCKNSLRAANKVKAFHWFLEFPEVFEKGGFNGVVGNPPFMGGMQIPTYINPTYASLLKTFMAGMVGTADLVAYFFRRAFTIIKKHGYFGLIATKSISESDTRQSGLDFIVNNDGFIYRAETNIPWPGKASVLISIVQVFKGQWTGNIYKDKSRVNSISSSLDEHFDFQNVKRLSHGIDYSEGTKLYGGAFILSKDDFEKENKQNPSLEKYIRVYVNGDVLNGTPLINGDLYVIDFGELEKIEIDDCREILEYLSVEITKERKNQTRQIHETRPWLHWDKRTAFYNKARNLERILACTIVSTNLAFIFTDPNKLYAHGIKLFADSRCGFFGLLQSSIHDVWARATSSRLGSSIRYSTSSTFDKFPLFDQYINKVEEVGELYHDFRSKLMIAEGIGLTSIYNNFHNPVKSQTQYENLRDLHKELDYSVTSAYGWNDINLKHGFYETKQGTRFTINEDARYHVLNRLIKLNHDLYEEEVRAGQAESNNLAKTRRKSNVTSPESTAVELKANGQISLGMPLEPVPETKLELSPKPDDALSIDQLERWGWYRCAACNATVMGFNAEEHIKEKHGNVDVGFIKPNV